MIRIGVDLGGTKIEVAVLDRDNQIIERNRVSTPEGYEDTLETITRLVAEMEACHGGQARIGVGHPGSVSPKSGLIRGANSTWLNSRDFGTDLQNLLGRPTRFANDADCFALSESLGGAGFGHDRVFGVILGTGVGGGIVLGGQLQSGIQNIAGEWGHTALPWLVPDEYRGPGCWCGKTGCIEAWLSGPGIVADFARRTGKHDMTANILAIDTELSLYADRLARGLSTVINILDPDIIVLGGGVSNTPGLPEQIAAALPAHVFSDHVATQVARHQHGDSSGVRGAAMLWSANA